MLAAAIAMAVLTRVLADLIQQRVGTAGLAAQLATGLVPVVAGTLLYFVLTQLLRVGEAHAFSSLVLQRLGRR
jgi:hypothetical protein